MNAMATSRANETPELSLERTKQNKSNMTTLRQLQLPEVSARQNLNAKFRMASLRVNDSVESSISRVTQSRLRMQQSRHKLLSIDEAMLAFHAFGVQTERYTRLPTCAKLMCMCMIWCVVLGQYTRRIWHPMS